MNYIDIFLCDYYCWRYPWLSRKDTRNFIYVISNEKKKQMYQDALISIGLKP